MPRRTSSPPVIAPKDGLRQRELAGGHWRIWWEPTARQRSTGAKPLDLSHLRPGEAQRRATAEAARWSSAAPATPRGYSVAALIEDYQRSRYYTEKAFSTQATYRVDLRAIAEKWGSHAAAAITAPVMVQWYETLLTAKGPSRARALLTMFSILMVHAERRGWIPKGTNPCTDIGMQRPAPRSRVADARELTALLAVASGSHPAMALALRLAMHTGQRATDIRMARLGDFQPALFPVPGLAEPVPGYVWRLVRSKRGNAGVIPILDPDTIAALNARRAGSTDPGAALLLNGHGQPFTRDRFQKTFADLRADAALLVPSIASLDFHDLRRTLAVQLRMAGVARDDAGDLLGNTLATNAVLAATYTPVTDESTLLRAIAAVTPLPERKKA